MLRFFFVFFFCIFCANAQQNSLQAQQKSQGNAKNPKSIKNNTILQDYDPSLPLSPSKIIYIKNITPEKNLKKMIYVGQSISITYNLLPLSNASLAKTEFTTPINPQRIKLTNPDVTWDLQPDKSYQATFTYKIKSKNASLPQIKATAISDDGKYQDSALTPKIALNIYDLKSNPKYSGVVADDLKILRTKTKNYDDMDYIMVLELEGKNANLEDFVLPDSRIKKQEAKKLEDGHGIYYCIFPKNISSLSFDFFSLTTNHFKTLTIPVILSHDNVAAQDDLKPKNIFLLYFTLLLILGILVCVLLYIFLWRSKWLLLLAVLLLCYLLWHIFYRNDIILQPNDVVKILPTQNSTTLFVPTSPMEAEIIGSHENFYKIITKDGHIGWIKKKKK
ncbi:hypothetical protein [Helicobacter mustelae]|uniref:Putative inner membrane protein n=1 Tax=Helicobacter mustelae (strain ATCC 43772 / CCUG 25715 / CIP 103759 / LMG 18044 / NCTC 12198 / R85-136P) TaxID=679897 RepID=D3UI75_HELM1|nr:hypothetical protein [Helicobacter mustelae]CBG40198.1 putative inner membrane protein [Helicobacter mustelae 12198]SQH71700.1 putative inner membrane protein [Helicobacter mustelae]STP12826.1 putative inner membrane protein [Helicobacter mustelae]